MIAVAYRRVSTEEQRKHGYSLEEQEERLRQFCERKGWTLVQQYTDVQRGRRDDRKEYQEMLARVRQGGIQHIVVKWLDRFGRKPREILRRYWELEESGVTVECTEEDVKEELMLLMKAGLAGFESKRLGDRVRGVISYLHERGNWVTQYPLGYTLDPNTRRLAIVDEEAQIVRDIYQWYRDGIGYETIAQRLNRDGKHGKRGAAFWPRSIKLILTNPTYAGHSTRKDVFVHNTHEAIIPPPEWSEMQQLVAYRSRVRTPRYPDRPFPLAGLVRCGHCGRWLYTWMPQHRTQSREPQRFYRCGGNKTGLCHLPIITAGIVERWLLLQAVTWGRDMQGVPPASTWEAPRIGDLEADLRRIQAAQKRAYNGWVDGMVDEASYRAKAVELRREAEQVQARLADAEASQRRLANREQTITTIANFATLWYHLNDHERREALRDFVQCIEIHGNREFRLVFRPEFAFLSQAQCQD